MLLNVFREYMRQGCPEHVVGQHQRVCLVCSEPDAACAKQATSASGKKLKKLASPEDESMFATIVDALKSQDKQRVAVVDLYEQLQSRSAKTDSKLADFPSLGQFGNLCKRAKQSGLVQLGDRGISTWIELNAANALVSTKRSHGFRRAASIETAESKESSLATAVSRHSSVSPAVSSRMSTAPGSEIVSPLTSGFATPVSTGLSVDGSEIEEDPDQTLHIDQDGVITGLDMLDDFSSSDEDDSQSESSANDMPSFEDDFESDDEIGSTTASPASAEVESKGQAKVEFDAPKKCSSCSRIRDGKFGFYYFCLIETCFI